MKQALNGGSLVVFGDGEQRRDFVYIDDVVDALSAAAVASGVDREIINVGSGQDASVNGVVRLVLRVTGRKGNVLRNEQQGGGISRMVADLRRARTLLRYEPQVDLETGLQLLLQTDPRFH
jgi:UDP-glucose 4-epimerase